MFCLSNIYENFSTLEFFELFFFTKETTWLYVFVFKQVEFLNLFLQKCVVVIELNVLRLSQLIQSICIYCLNQVEILMIELQREQSQFEKLSIRVMYLNTLLLKFFWGFDYRLVGIQMLVLNLKRSLSCCFIRRVKNFFYHSSIRDVNIINNLYFHFFLISSQNLKFVLRFLIICQKWFSSV